MRSVLRLVDGSDNFLPLGGSESLKIALTICLTLSFSDESFIFGYRQHNLLIIDGRRNGCSAREGGVKVIRLRHEHDLTGCLPVICT